ncbi:MAG: RadC family protein [Caldicoprobacterales bacterium]|jgi:DNA repair protein RadC|nr:DNA repair protein RadC [Clostridiales bacterium]
MHEGHRERMKNRFLSENLDHFNQHQVLELLLFYTIPRRDTNPLAHDLIQRYGSLTGVLEAGFDDLIKVDGVSRNTALFLTLIPHLCRRYLKDKQGDKPQLNSSSKAGNYAKSLFYGRPYEAFYVICLDAQNKVNHAALVHEGTIDSAPVYPRVIVEAALRHKAAAMILAHNHPGGSLQPSAADLDATRKICSACDAISIRVVDHIIVAGEQYFSFADRGLI